jgi:hypothetical protein
MMSLFNSFDKGFGIQFVTGIARAGADLLVGYGDLDCEAQVRKNSSTRVA